MSAISILAALIGTLLALVVLWKKNAYIWKKENQEMMKFLRTSNWQEQGYYFRQNYQLDGVYAWVFFNPRHEPVFREKTAHGVLGRFMREKTQEWHKQEKQSYQIRKYEFLQKIS